MPSSGVKDATPDKMLHFSLDLRASYVTAPDHCQAHGFLVCCPVV